MNFVPLLLVHLCIRTAYAGNVYERELRRTVQGYQADWSVITLAAPKLASIIKGVPHEFCSLLLVHLCNTLLLAMLMIARCGVTAETAC
jgi:hypothetical protein